MTIKRADYKLRSDLETDSITEDEFEIPPGQQTREEDEQPASPDQQAACSGRRPHREDDRPQADNARARPRKPSPDALAQTLLRINERLDRLETERKEDRREDREARRATDRALQRLLSPSRSASRRRSPQDDGRRTRAASPRPAGSPADRRDDRSPPRRRPASRDRHERQRSLSRSPRRRASPRHDADADRRRSKSAASPRDRRTDQDRRDRRRHSRSPRRHLDASPEALVRAILSTTKRGLRHKRGVNPEYIYPFELIERGTEKKAIKRGEATYQEYAVALRFMEKQSAFSTSDIEALREHSLQVAEDARVLPWPIVRGWSEEIFDRIADGRLPKGWKDPAALMYARLAQIQIAAITPAPNNDTGYARGRSTTRPAVFDRDDRDAGKPCGPWNRSEASCTKAARGQSHQEDGLKLVHMCAFCAYKLGKVLYHSEAVCSNKKRNAERKPDGRGKDF